MTVNGTIEAKGTDSVGNESGIGSLVVGNIDRTPPNTPNLTPDVTTPTNGNVTVTIDNWGDAAVKQYRID